MSHQNPLIAKLDQQHIEKCTFNPPDFREGDTLKVGVKVVEGENQRIQMFEGVCIARKNCGASSTFTVRKISYGEGVERVFPLYSYRVASIDVLKRGRVRRGKLYYLRGRRGKSARITERVVKRVAKVDKKSTTASAKTDETKALNKKTSD